ncbi:MAG: transglycosylase SLT domain-containing protein [Bdellovibrionaceae bacterium]|nr:transglycosylase SLT domain-containing protein [Pseudobdellovibrionaceae bacterium]
MTTSASHIQPNLVDLKAELEKRLVKKNDQVLGLIFDLPVSYNWRVTKWIRYFQEGSGQKWFATWLEKSTQYMPYLQHQLKKSGLPGDLAYMVMIESGFNPYAISKAKAVGPWQFIEPTARRYGLQINGWLDERRDFEKSTLAAIRYLKDLYQEFGSWYLVAASYNMGENGLRKQITKLKTKDFWTLAQSGALPQETTDYVPKILAAMLIAKAPSLYGFTEVPILPPYSFQKIKVKGGIHLSHIADQLNITHQALYELNPELKNKSIPSHIGTYYIKVPYGSARLWKEPSLQVAKNNSPSQPPTSP